MRLKHASFLLLAIISFQVAFAQTPEIPKDTSYNVNAVYRQVRAKFPMALPAKDSVTKEIEAARNIIYTTLATTPNGKRDLHLDIFRPKKTGKYPAIIMVHGGGWRSGTKEMQVPMAQMLAAKGYVTITVEYQLSLEAKFPAAVYNIKSAIRWVHANADKYGIDTSRISISGCSAGGQLASLVGLTNGVQSFEGDHGNAGWSSFIHAIIDIDGVIDFMAPNSLNSKRQPTSPDVEWLGGTFDSKPLTWKDASPIFWATEKTALPMLFVNSGFSRFHTGQDELIGMLKEWGITNEVHKFDIKMHPFWLFHPWVDETVGFIEEFLKKVYSIK